MGIQLNTLEFNWARPWREVDALPEKYVGTY